MAICKRCGEDRELIEAHVIPRRFWEYSDKPRRPLAVLASRPGWVAKRSRTGEYDSEILCGHCDQLFGVFDQHATENLLGKTGNSVQIVPHQTMLQYPTVEAAKIHRFITSLAWRASVSKRDYFSRVSLGPYENTILNSIQSKSPDFELLATFIAEFDQNEVPFLNPQYSTMDSVKFLVIFASRFTFYLKVDKRPLPHYFEPFRIDPSRVVTTYLRKWEGSKQFDAVVKLVRTNTKPTFW
jgi:hypothetical protein